MKKILTKILIALLVVSVTVMALQNMPQANAQGKSTPIDECAKITKTGNYGLTKDVSDASSPIRTLILIQNDLNLDCKGNSKYFHENNAEENTGRGIVINKIELKFGSPSGDRVQQNETKPEPIFILPH